MLNKLPFHHRKKALDYLVGSAGNATAPPPPPSGGIPRQHLPGFIRWPIRVLIVPFVFLDILMQKLARKIVLPPFRQLGTCRKRGNCCHYILIGRPKNWLEYLHLFWCLEINGFFLRDESGEYEGKEMLVMGCRYLKKNGSCAHYYLRPTICRQWPIIEYFAYPQILKGCGFYAVSRDHKKSERGKEESIPRASIVEDESKND